LLAIGLAEDDRYGRGQRLTRLSSSSLASRSASSLVILSAIDEI
jgi:hypothetical protein